VFFFGETHLLPYNNLFTCCQAELRWRLRSVYDRQEVNDLVRFLEEEGFVNLRCDCLIDRDESGIVGALDEREENGVFWLIGTEKHWFQM